MIVSSRGGLFSFFNKDGCWLPTGRQVFCVFFLFFCLLLWVSQPSHESHNPSAYAVLQIQWGKPQGCFYISVDLVPLYVNWCTCLICIAIVNIFKCFLMLELFLLNVRPVCVTKHRRRIGNINKWGEAKKAFKPHCQAKTTVHLSTTLKDAGNLILEDGTWVKRPFCRIFIKDWEWVSGVFVAWGRRVVFVLPLC